ncbi:MAG: Hsp70 family protein [Sulfurospirillaceae bacterium]|nr:Hsp70 family protein [Sulfurospirillaceae bacterium]
MSNIVGIDLGTTMSAIAVLNSVGKPEIIPNIEGERLTPSVIFYESNEKLFIGTEAKNTTGEEYAKVAKEFKREMHNETFSFDFKGQHYSAIELSSLILKKLVQDASKQVGEIKDVVISVPAYFKESQRSATMQAGKLAGLNVIGIVNEPTAAALFYATVSKIAGRGLVYDLGGGTFDVTITQTDGNDIKIIASEGDAHLGGLDFDQVLLDLIATKYEAVIGEKLYKNDASKHEFLLQAEEMKKSLSSKNSIKQKIRGDSGSATIEITQSEFEEKISTYISRTELLVEQVLDEAKCEVKDIDYILLVGGSTRIPAIQKSIRSLMKKEPINAVNVDEAVALGAAIKAGLITVKDSPNKVSSTIAKEMKSLNVSEVTNHSYGAITLSFNATLNRHLASNTIILKKNTPIPSSASDTFYTTHQGQEIVEIKITQGESDDPDFVDIIAKFELKLPPNREEGCPIKVTYSYDDNAMMHCQIFDVNSEKTEEYKVALKIDASKKASLDSFLID